MMRKRFCLVLFVVCLLSICGCGRYGRIDFDYYNEKSAFDNTIHALFDALDRKDAEAVYDLFSPAVRVQDEGLKEQIQKLLSVYQGPTDEIGWDGLSSGGGHYEGGKKSKYASAVFPVRSGGTYFWCYLKITYIDTFDETQLGITQLDFYTAEEYCIMRYGEDEKHTNSVGLRVHAERTLGEEVRCIDGYPYKYSSSTGVLNLEEVLGFFESSNSLADFKAQFGEPNAEHIFLYYELPEEDGKPRYLQISEHKDTIGGVYIVDELGYVETVFDADEK